MSLKQEELIAAIDAKSGRFRIDKVRIITPDATYRGAGVLECGEKLMLSITLPKGKDISAFSKNIVARKDFWKLKGVIEDSLNISIDSLPPISKKHYGNGSNVVVFGISEFDVEPAAFDKKTNSQIMKMLAAHRTDAPKANPKKARRLKKENPEVSFFAVLKDYKLIALNKGTEIVETNEFLGKRPKSRMDTCMGILPGWKYGLIQVVNDVHVHLKSDEIYVSRGKEEDSKHLEAVLRAIAFTHGQHAWPSQLEYRCDHKMLTNKIRVIRNVSRTHHAPFSERLWHNNLLGNVKWDFSETFQKAYEFFLSGTELSKEIEELVYLLREAGGDNIPLRIELLTVCTLYESLMRAIFSYQSKGKAKTKDVLAFIKSKASLIKELKRARRQEYGG